jgi:hypothetical protein
MRIALMSDVLILRTEGCSNQGHREFELHLDPAVALPRDGEWLLRHLEETVAAGEKYEPGQTLRIGWMHCRIIALTNGRLGIEEPDFVSFPMRFTESVSLTLAHLRLQRDVADSVSLLPEAAWPCLVDTAVLCTALGESPGYVMDRTEMSQGESGWFAGCLGGQHDHNDLPNLRRASIYELAVNHTVLIPFFALPVGAEIVLDQGKVRTIRRNGRDLTILPGSYLSMACTRAHSGQ